MVSRVAVTTQVNAVWVPPRSPMIRGSALETTVVASIETNIAEEEARQGLEHLAVGHHPALALCGRDQGGDGRHGLLPHAVGNG